MRHNQRAGIEMICKINILAIFILLSVLLFGCTTHINQVKDKWGPPAKVESQGERLIYYYHFYVARVGKFGAKSGWVVHEITTDRDGKILGTRKYWKQPEIK
jgi:hypothetical protein